MNEIAEQLQVTTNTIKIWRRHGLLLGHPYNDKKRMPVRSTRSSCSRQKPRPKNVRTTRFAEVVSHRTNKVQHAT